MRIRFVAVAALILALGLAWSPSAVVQACSCANVGGPVEVALAAAADPQVVAFTGRVVDARAAGDGAFGGPVVAYSFEVDRASKPLGSLIEVNALDDPGGASCGFTFGVGEEWFVAAYAQDGALETNLCSGNVPTQQLDAASRARLAEALPELPDPVSAPVRQEPPWSLLLAVTGILVASAVTVLAFRGRAAR